MFYKRNGRMHLGIQYSMGFGLAKYTPLPLCIESLAKLLYKDF